MIASNCSREQGRATCWRTTDVSRAAACVNRGFSMRYERIPHAHPRIALLKVRVVPLSDSGQHLLSRTQKRLKLRCQRVLGKHLDAGPDAVHGVREGRVAGVLPMIGPRRHRIHGARYRVSTGCGLAVKDPKPFALPRAQAAEGLNERERLAAIELRLRRES